MRLGGTRAGLKARRDRREGEENLVPLINIVFLLLIFFMVTGQLATLDPFEIEPPASVAESDSGERTATVMMAADGRIALDGVPMNAAALSAGVAALIDSHPGLRLHLKVDAAAEAGAVIALMERLREAGIADLTLLTAARGGGRGR